MASANAKATRRAMARQRLDDEVAVLAGLLDIEIPEPGRPVQDPDLAAIIEMERQGDLLAGITGAVVAQIEQHVQTTQRVAEVIMQSVSGRESLSDEEQAELAQIVAEVADALGKVDETDPEDESAEGEDEPETPVDTGTHSGNVYLDALTRAQLNELAVEKGIEAPEKLPNKPAVIDAIKAATPPAGEGEPL